MSKERHKWIPSGIKGCVECSKCGLEVKESDRHRGGLGPCELGKWIIEKGSVENGELIACPRCGQTVPNVRICLYCGFELHPIGWFPNLKGGFDA